MQTQTDDRYLSSGVLVFVILAHLALFAGARFLRAPELPIEPPGLSFVDLGMMGGGEAGGGGGGESQPAPPAPEPPKPPPRQEQPKPRPRAEPKPQEQIKPVIRRDDKPADIVQPPPKPQREEPKPEPQQPKPEIRQETARPESPPPSRPQNEPAGHSGAGNAQSEQAGGRGSGSGGGEGNRSGSGRGGEGSGSGGGSGGGSGSGGGGGGDFVAASHIGGYLNNPRPPYPPQLQEEGVSGSVRLQVMVEANGKPSSVRVLSASHPLFARSAEQTVRERYTFRPATRGGEPIRHSYTFTIRFNAPR